MSQFASPVSNAQLPAAEVLNHLLIIKPHSVEHDIVTTYGPSDAIRCDVADLTTGLLHEGVLWFPKGLVSALQSRIGQMVLAAMTQGQAKPGQDPPWVLADCAEDPNAVLTAQAWLAQNPTFDPARPTFNQPTAAAPVPAYQPPPVAAPVAAPVAPATAYQQAPPVAAQPAQPAYQAPAATYQSPVNPNDI
jgi:hypothetical protein